MNNTSHLAPLPKWIRAKKYAELSGISEEAIKKKRLNGVWLEGLHWKKAPDKNIMIDWHQCDNWVENGQTPTRH